MGTRSPQTLTPSELAHRQGLAYHTILRRCQRGEIPAFRVGMSYRIPGPGIRPLKRTLTIFELCKRWGVHRSTVHTLLKRRELRSFMRCGSRRITAESVVGFERRHALGG